MKIGVVTVTYNSSLVLEDFFSSIENQDFLDFHLINPLSFISLIE